jgi:hypothetical protein
VDVVEDGYTRQAIACQPDLTEKDNCLKDNTSENGKMNANSTTRMSSRSFARFSDDSQFPAVQSFRER